jgi:hypothetical protein
MKSLTPTDASVAIIVTLARREITRDFREASDRTAPSFISLSLRGLSLSRDTSDSALLSTARANTTAPPSQVLR